MQAEQVVGEVAGHSLALGGGVDSIDPVEQRVHGFGAALHARGLQHELGQRLRYVDAYRALLVLHQVVNEVLRVNAYEDGRELLVYHAAGRVGERVEVSDLPVRHVVPRVTVEIVQMIHQSPARVGG